MRHSLVFDADVELARAVADGLLCMECGVSFHEPHHEPVCCEHCWPKLAVEDRVRIARATHPEVNRLAWRNRNRAKKASKWAGFALAPRTVQENEE